MGELYECLELATYTAFITITQFGASTAIPYRKDVESLIKDSKDAQNPYVELKQ